MSELGEKRQRWVRSGDIAIFIEDDDECSIEIEGGKEIDPNQQEAKE